MKKNLTSKSDIVLLLLLLLGLLNLAGCGKNALSGSGTEDSALAYACAENTAATQENVMILRVGTGSRGTDRISGFTVRYVDRDGQAHEESISSSRNASYSFAGDWSHCGLSEDQKGDSLLRTHNGNAALSAGGQGSRLEALSSYTYILQTEFPLSYVTSISVATSGSGTWTCTELNLYRVAYLYPLQEYGYGSEAWYIPFTGTLIAETALDTDEAGLKSKAFTWKNESIEIGTEEGGNRLNIYGAPASLKSLQDENGVLFYGVTEDARPYSTLNEEFTFSISLADTPEAGMETFYHADADTGLTDIFKPGSSEFNTLLHDAGIDLSLRYQDTNGSVRSVTLPFTLSAAEWCHDRCDADSKELPIHGLFQQGEEIVFSGVLPDYSKGLEATLHYSDIAPTASVAITAFSISRPAAVEVAVEDGVLRVDYPDSAVDYYSAPDAKGVTLATASSLSVALQSWNGRDSLKPGSGSNRYLVVVETEAMPELPHGDILLCFRYRSFTGTSADTEEYSLKSEVGETFGYWLTTEGGDAPCAYEQQLQSGTGLSFVLEAENLYRLESASLRFAEESSEDEAAQTTETAGENSWQMKSVSVYELEELGQRRVILGQLYDLGEYAINRIYYRENSLGRRGCISYAKGPLTLAPGESKTLSFTDGETASEGNGENKATDVRKLSYAETRQDFGFNTRRSVYTVSVKVADEGNNSVRDGDSGSVDQFYFQLVFRDESGRVRTSPCVLANSQLQTKGFRSDTEESFVIYTNGDYGTPVQVNVIPDDTSSVSDEFDRLKIEYISVSSTSADGVRLRWQTEENKVGWIDIDTQQSPENGNTGLTRSFALKDQGYGVRIEFGIVTGSEYVNDRQYVGSLLADISYLDSNGAKRTASNIDVVSLMAAYAERKTELRSSGIGGAATSNAEYMFLRGGTNRFFLDFDDISSLISIRFKATPEAGSNLKLELERVFARQVYGDGTLERNVFGEYERRYSAEPRALTATDNASGLTLGTSLSGKLSFNSGNSVLISRNNDQQSVWVSEGYSEGLSDRLSMTLELEDISGIVAGTALPVRLIYKNIYGDAYQLLTELVFDANSGVFMMPENNLADTPNIAAPYRLEITGGNCSGRKVLAGKVYQLRDREVTESYTFVPEEGTKLDSTVPTAILLSESRQEDYQRRRDSVYQTETVYLQLGDGTKNLQLSVAQDLEVALVYTEKDDPYGYKHTSDYVSALECGNTEIDKDTVLVLSMAVPNVASVKSIMIRTSSEDMVVNARKGCISISENTAAAGLSTGWVNLPASTTGITTEGTAMISDGQDLTAALNSNSRITPLQIRAQFSSVNRNDVKVKLTLHYLGNGNASKSATIDRLASEWNSGGSWLLVDGLQNIQYYTLDTYDTDASHQASVSVGSMNLGWYSPTGAYSSSPYTGAVILTEGTAVMNDLVNSCISGTVGSSDGLVSAPLEGNAVSSGRTDFSVLRVTGSADIVFRATLPGYYQDLKVTVSDVTTGSIVSVFDTYYGTDDTLQSVVSLANTLGTGTQRYSIRVESKSLPERYAAQVYVDVEPGVIAESILLLPDGTMKLFTMNCSSSSRGTTVCSDALYPGDVICFYGRTLSSTESISLYASPSDGTAFTLSTAYGVTLPGYEGSWTELRLTMAEVTEERSCEVSMLNQGQFMSTLLRFTLMPRPVA